MAFFKTLWQLANAFWQGTLTLSGGWFWLAVLLLHVLLALATVACSGRSVCELGEPFRRLFRMSWDALADGVIELVFGIPRLLVYLLVLYLRAYVLLARVLFVAWIAGIPGLLTVMALYLLLWLILSLSVEFDEALLDALILPAMVLCWAYWYWKIDGESLWRNTRASLACLRR
jgi:hypothetical protein